MSSAAKKVVSRRYVFTKLINAGEEFMYQLLSSRQQQAAKQANGFSGQLSSAVSKFKEVYSQQMTTVMYLTGNAMAPHLNKVALKDSDAVEKLVVRCLPRPSSRSILVGDVVAFNSPLSKGPEDASHVMVRRVAAVEGDEMVSNTDDDEEEALEIPKGHCWVLADNPSVKPPQVIDSRTFGFIPMSSIIGRVIYAASSTSEHGPVINSAESVEADRPVIEAEVDVEQLFTISK